MERASCGRCGRAHNALVCHACKSCALGMQFLLQTLAIQKCPKCMGLEESYKYFIFEGVIMRMYELHSDTSTRLRSDASPQTSV